MQTFHVTINFKSIDSKANFQSKELTTQHTMALTFFSDPFLSDFDFPLIERELLGPARRARQARRHDLVPTLKADVVERERDYEVHVDLPGVDPADVEVTVANGFLHIAAERKQVHEEKSEFSHTIERSFGRVQRSVPVPKNAVGESADARFNNGVLTVVLAKKPAVEPGRKLEIKIGASSSSAAPSSSSSLSSSGSEATA